MRAVGPLLIVVACSPEGNQEALVVELAEPRAATSVDASNEFGCVEFLRLTYVPGDLAPAVYDFTLRADGKEAHCALPVPFECRAELRCDWPCKQTDAKCTGDLKVSVFSRDGCEREPSFELTSAPDAVLFEVRRGSELVRSETITPRYDAFAPNGAEPPVCKQAGVDLGGRSTQRFVRRSAKERAADSRSSAPSSGPAVH